MKMGPIEIAGIVVVVGSAFGLLMRALIACRRRAELRGYIGYKMVIAAGTGAGQERKIVEHIHDEVVLDRPWDVAPDSTSVFELH